ncbi:hypothetical protein MEK_05099 [Candida albicans 12C]|nr:hypothetical protein MG9_05110 [Candida albicans P37037]KGT65167.1 hypothetical protein MEK_05099 [Candida albicans 12C]
MGSKNKRYSYLPASKNDHFNAENEIKKYHLDVSTFDVIRVNNFRNYNCSTLFWYFYMWVLIFLSFALLATDIYSCLNILVFHRWASDDYKPYAYSIAKWIFTGCIIFQFVLLFYHWIWAIHIARTRNIALVYLNSIAKRIYSIKYYDNFCLLNSINEGHFFDWCCFLTYYEIDNALQILVADTPRQVINILTLRYYATGGELNNNILNNIEQIANTNLYLSIILSFMCLSVFIYAIFFLRFVFGMLCYIPLKIQLSNDGYKSFKDYCCHLINESIADAVRLHHKPKKVLLEQGILSEERIAQLPVLEDRPPRYNDYSKTFYRTDTSATLESNIPLNYMKDRSNSTNNSRDDFGGHSNQKVYSPINDQNNGIGKRLSQLREKYTQPSYGVIEKSKPVDSIVGHEQSLYKSRQRSQASLLSEDQNELMYKQPRSTSLTHDTSRTHLNNPPKRSITDISEQIGQQNLPSSFKPMRKAPTAPLGRESHQNSQDINSLTGYDQPVQPLPKSYTQDHPHRHKYNDYAESITNPFGNPSSIYSGSVDDFSRPMKTDYTDEGINPLYSQIKPLKKSTTEPINSFELSYQTPPETKFKRSFTDEYPITEEDRLHSSQDESKVNNQEEDQQQGSPTGTDIIDDFLEELNAPPEKEPPYPVRGVSKYFET